jgi:hypothetical protein
MTKLTIAQMKRNLADKAIWARVLSGWLYIAFVIVLFVYWPLALVTGFAVLLWKAGKRIFFQIRRK